MIANLEPLNVSTILWQICTADPRLSHYVITAHKERLLEEAAKEARRPPLNFLTNSKECWHAMNSRFGRKSTREQFEAMGDIEDVLNSHRNEILEGAGSGAKWETRRNALEVLRKISKSIMLCEIRRELMNGYLLDEFSRAMLLLAKDMTAREREIYKEEGLYEKLVDLKTECDWELYIEGLADIYELFDGDSGGNESNAEEAVVSSGIEELPAKEPTPPQRTRVFSVIELD